MANIQLELDYIDMMKKRERWNLYFLIATDMPGDSSKMAVSAIPDGRRVKLTRKTGDKYSFKPKGVGATGLIVFEAAMPVDLSVRVSLCVMQDRKDLRKTGDILSEVGDLAGDKNVQAKVISALGNFNPWIVVGSMTVGALGQIFEKVNDRNMGFLSLNQNFQEAQQGSFEYSNKVSTGFADLGWTWRVKEE